MQTKFTINKNKLNPMVGSYNLELTITDALSLPDIIVEVEKAVEDIKGMAAVRGQK
jgi:hypothetical protein